MKKIALGLIALATLSTAALAGGDYDPTLKKNTSADTFTGSSISSLGVTASGGEGMSSGVAVLPNGDNLDHGIK